MYWWPTNGNSFIISMACQLPEGCLFSFVGTYMMPRLSDQFVCIGSRFYLISSPRGTGPSLNLVHSTMKVERGAPRREIIYEVRFTKQKRVTVY